MPPNGVAAASPSAADMAAMHAQFIADSCGYIKSMYLRCAIELGIAGAIHRLGRPATIPEICAEVGVPAVKADALRRVMRLLVVMGYFTDERAGADDEEVYGLTAISKHYFVNTNMAPAINLRTHEFGVHAFRALGAWLRAADGPPSAFELANGKSLWAIAGTDESFNKVFNESMAAQPASFAFVPEGGHVFAGLRSLVDVGGGTGKTARAITAAYPHIKYTVFDLPHVIAAVPNKADYPGVSFVPGSMFDHIPKADAVLLKLILHDWNDESSVKILQKCKEAIAPKEEGGKVIIIDIVRDVGDRRKRDTSAADAYMDALMLVSLGGAERDEQQWKALFDKAGFSGYKITSVSATVQSIIEVFP